ncbi:homoserine O-succinyltransferase [Lysobacter sp. KIS68-7]|uniref:homoserine O-succinyltransferase MetX n=1 Tax=Lysobacter sp. KIS68-7 TaxID=2904252 RepID=UPI001E5204CE|nr:homoserine O-succinyltransferase [Lysobacter sp. KIS68-7]UHQ19742.1 homoserine O-succinyltransferase [Lysobacter sp. KIS68-7]
MSAALALNPQVLATPVADARRGEFPCSLSLRHAGVRDVVLRYELRGDTTLPIVAVLGGISAGRHVASGSTFGEPGWWERQRAVLDTQCVVSIDWLGADGTLDAPIDSFDQAAALAAVLDHLNIERLSAIVGSSYGAMVGLAFAAAYPQRVGHLVAIAGAHRPHPFASAWRALQRQIVQLGQLQCAETQGLSLARQLALLSYRTPEEFGARFDADATLAGGTAHCAAEQWLADHGASYAQRTPATAFLRLSESIDLHRVDPRQVRVPTTLIAFAEDRLVPVDDVRALAAGIDAAVRLRVLHSTYGHDAFLKEPVAIAACLRDAFEACAEDCA